MKSYNDNYSRHTQKHINMLHIIIYTRPLRPPFRTPLRPSLRTPLRPPLRISSGIPITSRRALQQPWGTQARQGARKSVRKGVRKGVREGVRKGESLLS